MPIRSGRLKCISTHLVVMPNAQHWFAIALAGSALSGCSLVKDQLGLTPKATVARSTGGCTTNPAALLCNQGTT